MFRQRLLATLACIGLGASTPTLPTAAQQPGADSERGPSCRADESSNTPFGASVDVSIVLHPGSPDVENVLSDPGGPVTQSVRLQISATPSAASRWTLEIRDSERRLLLRLQPSDFLEDERTSLWTGRFDVPQLRAELIGARSDEQVRIDRALVYDRDARGGSLFSTLGDRPNWTALHSAGLSLDRARAGDSVGMMVASALDGQMQRQSWCCSGVMLTPTLYLTNWHCGGASGARSDAYWDDETCASTLIDLAWDAGTRNRQYRCVRPLRSNEGLDYALLRVAPTTGRGGDDLRVSGTPIATAPLTADQSLFMIHHPSCLPKRLSVQSCRSRRLNLPAWRTQGAGGRMSDFSHTCDSERGSSGAPMFDSAGRMVGLHHLGFPRDPQCRPIPNERENSAVTMTSIMDDLSQTHPEIAAEIRAGQQR